MSVSTSAVERRLYEESLALFRELGDRKAVAVFLSNLGCTDYYQHEFCSANALVEESLELRRELGDKWGVATSLKILGSIARELGDYVAAKRLHATSLSLFCDLHDGEGTVESLEGLAYAIQRDGEPERAARILGWATKRREEINCPQSHGDRTFHEQHMTAIRVALSEDAAFDRAWQSGRAMTQEQAIDCASEPGAGPSAG